MLGGLTEIDGPEPTKVPLHDPVVQYHVASEPSRPPTWLNVADVPAQIDDGFELAEVGSWDQVITETVTLLQIVVVHVPSALTQ